MPAVGCEIAATLALAEQVILAGLRNRVLSGKNALVECAEKVADDSTSELQEKDGLVLSGLKKFADGCWKPLDPQTSSLSPLRSSRRTLELFRLGVAWGCSSQICCPSMGADS